MDKNKKPLHLLVFFTYGNSLQTWVKTGLMGRELLTYKKMIKQGCRVTFFTYGDIEDYNYSEQLEGIEVVPAYEYRKKSNNRWLNLFQSFFFPLDPRLKKYLSIADIYKTNQMVGVWVPLIAGLIYKKPLVVRCGYEMLRNMLRAENNRTKQIFKAIFGYMLEFIAYLSADKIIISNKSDLSFIKKLFPVKQNKISLIRNFIDTDQFSSSNITLKGNKINTILYIGRIETCKNISNLIKGISKTEYRLDIIGKGSQETALKTFVKKNQYNVNFLGLFNNQKLPEIIKKYDFFILPSLYECSPKTLLEAMACGRIVIGTNVDGIKELIEDKITGFLCDTNSKSISDIIGMVMNTDRSKLKKLGQNARQFAVRECSINKVFEKEMAVYSELIS